MGRGAIIRHHRPDQPPEPQILHSPSLRSGSFMMTNFSILRHFGERSAMETPWMFCRYSAAAISLRMARAAAAGSGACVIGRPTTRWLAPLRNVSAGVAIRF